jgi:hypothetical protein
MSREELVICLYLIRLSKDADYVKYWGQVTTYRDIIRIAKKWCADQSEMGQWWVRARMMETTTYTI